MKAVVINKKRKRGRVEGEKGKRKKRRNVSRQVIAIIV